MKRSKYDRRVSALAQLRTSTYENSRAKRLGVLTREEWQANKELRLIRLEESINGRPS
jgi:hypothetical protein